VTLTSAPNAGLVRAFGFSVLLHLALFWPVAPAWLPSQPASPLTVALRPVVPPVPTHEPLARPAVEPTLARRHAVPSLSPAPSPQAGSTLPGSDVVRLVSTGEPALRSETVPPAAVPAAAVPEPAASRGEEGVDPEGLRSYRLGLAREARRFRRYPPQAVEAGLAGTTELRVAVRPEGTVLGPQLTRSSGHPLLDDAALDMLRRALPATPIPASLQGRAFAVQLPIVFELPD
jgi:protein TonB